jgi:hypothetical protein
MPIEQPAPHQIADKNERVTEQTRETIRQSTEILRRTPSPNTFLGHKTQEPFPQEQDRADIDTEPRSAS